MIHRHRVRMIAASVPPRRIARSRATRELAPRSPAMSYWCVKHHRTPVVWSAAAEIPTMWVCRLCGLPAGLDKDQPPQPQPLHRSKTPLTHLRERRSEEELNTLLDESLTELRARRRAQPASPLGERAARSQS